MVWFSVGFSFLNHIFLLFLWGKDAFIYKQSQAPRPLSAVVVEISSPRKPWGECAASYKPFCIERGLYSRKEIEKEEWERGLHICGVQDGYKATPFLPLPHPDVKTEAACPRFISTPPHTPHEDYGQILATSPRVEDGLHLEVCEYGS